MLTKFVKFTLLLLGICILSAAPVFADTTHTFTFTSTLGPLMHSETFTSTQPSRLGTLSLTASGWERAFFSHNLFAKNEGPGEMGLGLVGGLDNEITNLFPSISAATAVSFVRLDIGSMLAGIPPGHLLSLSISMGSLTGGRDSYTVRGGIPSSGLGSINFGTSMNPTFNIPISNFLAGGTCGTAVGPCTVLNISAGANGQSVLLEDVQVVTTTPTPEPSSAGLLLIGFGALVAAGVPLGKKLIA